MLASTLLHYSSTAIAMPWEVGKLLLQVQWVPRDASDVLDLPAAAPVTVNEDEDGVRYSDLSSPSL